MQFTWIYPLTLNKLQMNKWMISLMLACNWSVALHAQDRNTANRDDSATVERYIDDHLLKLGHRQLYADSNLLFIIGHLRHTDTRAFRFVYKHAGKIDQTLGNGHTANDALRAVIEKELVNPILISYDKANREPAWGELAHTLHRKFGRINTEEVILDTRIRWYGYKKQWPVYAHLLVEKVETYGAFGLFDRPFQLNALAWEVFQRTSDAADLAKALEWSKEAVELSKASDASYIDTYANLLYKLGETAPAIQWEEKAVKLDPQSSEISANCQKMQSGLPTWPAM
jgi:tetratricopeptide (TPR) repeat protein